MGHRRIGLMPVRAQCWTIPAAVAMIRGKFLSTAHTLRGGSDDLPRRFAGLGATGADEDRALGDGRCGRAAAGFRWQDGAGSGADAESGRISRYGNAGVGGSHRAGHHTRERTGTPRPLRIRSTPVPHRARRLGGGGDRPAPDRQGPRGARQLLLGGRSGSHHGPARRADPDRHLCAALRSPREDPDSRRGADRAAGARAPVRRAVPRREPRGGVVGDRPAGNRQVAACHPRRVAAGVRMPPRSPICSSTRPRRPWPPSTPPTWFSCAGSPSIRTSRS